jgi:hypothetical protein
MPRLTLVLPRLTLRILVGLCVMAVLIGRYVCVPEPAAGFRLDVKVGTSPRYQAYGGFWFAADRHRPRLLDLETGAVVSFPLSGEERLDLLSCSPWRDGVGRYQLVGRWQGRTGPDFQSLPQSFGLARCIFPTGEVLDRLALDPIPLGTPCWYPDGSDRVLYSSGTHLYQVAFRGREGARGRGGSGSVVARPLSWRDGPVGRRVNSIHDPHWPTDTSLTLGGPLIASLSVRERNGSPADLGRRLWWLDLGRDGTEIVAAGRLLSSDPDASGGLARRAEERLPVVGAARDGVTMLAYLALERGRTTWDLWAVPIPRWEVGTMPKTLTSVGHKLAENCESVAPAFSADGRWVYAMRRHDGAGPSLECFPVATEYDPPSLAALSEAVN